MNQPALPVPADSTEGYYVSYWVVDLVCEHHKHATMKVRVGQALPEVDAAYEVKCGWCKRHGASAYHSWTWDQIREVIEHRDRRNPGLKIYPLNPC